MNLAPLHMMHEWRDVTCVEHTSNLSSYYAPSCLYDFGADQVLNSLLLYVHSAFDAWNENEVVDLCLVYRRPALMHSDRSQQTYQGRNG